MLARLHPCENSYPTRVSIYKQNFNELSNQICDFNNGFKCSDSHECEKLNNLSINIFELNFNQDNDKWKPNLLPKEIGTIESDKVIDLLVDKNLHALIKELNVFLGNHRKISICRRCFISYTIENRIRNHKENCGEKEICTFRSSDEFDLHWKDHFHKNSLTLGLLQILKLIMRLIIRV